MKNSVVGKVNFFTTLYMLCITFLPVFYNLSSSGILRILFPFMFLVWLVTGISNLVSIGVSIKRPISCLFLFLAIFFLYLIIGFGDANLYTVLNYLYIFGFGINGIYYLRTPKEKYSLRVLRFSIILISITTLTTVYYTINHPGIPRLLTSSSSDTAEVHQYRSLNIGSFGFIYSLVILLPVIIWGIRNKCLTNKRLLFFITLILFLACIFLSYFTTALIFSVVAITVSFIIMKKDLPFKKAAVPMMLLVVLLPSLFVVLINYLLPHLDSIYAANKLESLLSVLDSKQGLDDSTPRSELIKISINSFLGSPIWGVGSYYSTEVAKSVGQHAQFIDDFARYGLIGGIPLLLLSKWAIKKINKSLLYKKYNNPFYFSLVLTILLGLVNPIYNAQILASVFLVIPLFVKFYINENPVYNRLQA